MNKVIQIGNICAINKNNFSWNNPQPGRVYDINGISPTLNTMQGGHRFPYIVIKENKDDQKTY